MEGSRLTRNIRIAVTALSLTACVLLIALWVRSYWYWDQFSKPASKTHLITLESASSRVSLSVEFNAAQLWGWRESRELQDEYWAGPLKSWQEVNRYMGVAGFAIYSIPGHTTYRAPYWFPVLASATLAVIPWLRFSLRTLLIAITLVAVGLGVVLWLS